MIIAIKEKDRVVVASIITENITQLSHNDFVNEDNRIIKITGDTIYCFSTVGRYADLFLCDDNFFEFEVSPKSIVKDIIPYMYQKIKQEKGIEDERWDDPNWGNTLTIINNNRIFDITPTFYFREESEFVCHGWDVEYIYDSLENTRTEKAEERIRKAIDLYDNLGKSNLYPFIVMDSRDSKIQIWEK